MKHYLLPKNTKTHVLLWDNKFNGIGGCVVGSELYGGPTALAITSKDYYFNEDMIVSFDRRFYCDFNEQYEYIRKDRRAINIGQQKTYYRMFFYPEDCKVI